MSNLPTPSSATPPSEIDPWDLWHDVVVEFKKRFMQPSFWQAIEAVIPIVIEGGAYVVGLPTAAGHYASHLNGAENRIKLERIAQELSGLPLKLRVIDGTEESDWEEIKRREQAAQNAQQAFRSRLDSPVSANRSLTWEALQERVYSMFSRAQGHHLPQGRVKYMLQVIPVIAEGAEKLTQGAPEGDDRNERALARILDKVAGLVEVPSAVVALEYLRYLDAKKRRAGS